MKRKKQKERTKSEGYILPIIIVIGFIVLIGGLASVTRSLTGVRSSVRQSQAADAREIAEGGIARTVAELNSKYPYLLINDLNKWSNPDLPSAICPGRNTSGQPDISRIINIPSGGYRITSYEFEGTQFYGGTATLKVTGERTNANRTKILATATVQVSFDVKPKNCGAAYNQPATSSGYPGLLGWTINLGGNDVLGLKSGNVMCIECQSISEFGQNSQSVVSGELFMGAISMPDVPRFPSTLSASETAITSSETITAGSTNGGMCAVDSGTPPITHCRISSISLSGNNILKINSASGPVRLYISGDVSAGGQAGIRHYAGVDDSPSPGRLALFGNPLDLSNSTPDQSIVLAGVSKPVAKAANLFAYFPDGTTGIQGGAQSSAECSEETGECGGGDIRGSVWTKRWDGSNSNNAQLVVPENMPDIARENFGEDFAISIRDYVALGTNSWRGFQGF